MHGLRLSSQDKYSEVVDGGRRVAVPTGDDERFLELTSSSPGLMEKILPTFVASVESNLEVHWSKCVQQVTANV
jgi:hypothetical protein